MNRRRRTVAALVDFMEEQKLDRIVIATVSEGGLVSALGCQLKGGKVASMHYVAEPVGSLGLVAADMARRLARLGGVS